MSTESFLMAAVAKGASRQEAHEHIRVLSHEAAAEVKQHGRSNDLVERVQKDPFFQPILEQLDSLMDPKHFIGR